MNYVDKLNSRGELEARQNAQRITRLTEKGIVDRSLRKRNDLILQELATRQLDAADRFRHDYPLIASGNNGQKTA